MLIEKYDPSWHPYVFFRVRVAMLLCDGQEVDFYIYEVVGSNVFLIMGFYLSDDFPSRKLQLVVSDTTSETIQRCIEVVKCDM